MSVPDIPELVAIVQSGAITIVFLVLSFRFPKMWAAHQDHRERMADKETLRQEAINKFFSDERALDRSDRHKIGNEFSIAVGEMFDKVIVVMDKHEAGMSRLYDVMREHHVSFIQLKEEINRGRSSATSSSK